MPEFLQTEPLVVINPLEQPEWDSQLAGHPESCFFHSAAWAKVLNQTYGHRPYYICRFSAGRLCGLLAIMEVTGCVTGRRGVSLPFSDFCPVLKSNEAEEKELFDAALEQGRTRRWRYLEGRSGKKERSAVTESVAFFSHRIDLTSGPATLSKNFSDSTRRAIRKAEKTGVQLEISRTLESIQAYYALHCQTRRRHGLPPQPFRFFENIGKYALSQGQGFVATALLNGKPVAAAVFLHNDRQVIYKFGASDFIWQHLRANHFLMGKVIEYCATKRFQELHLGRTSLTNDGLRRFKTGFGASEEKIDYCKFDFAKEVFVTGVDRAESWSNGVFRRLPLPLLRLAGRVLYPNLS